MQENTGPTIYKYTVGIIYKFKLTDALSHGNIQQEVKW